MTNKIVPSSTYIESVNPKTLTKNELLQIAQVEKDMWASWIWEYVQCNNCWEIHSKSDIFWHLSKEIRTDAVVRLEEIFLWDSINCQECWSRNTKFMFDVSDNVKIISARYNSSVDSFLSLMYDNAWNIIWLSDWYIDRFALIFHRELSMYYWQNTLQKIFENDLFNDSDNYFCWASVWIIEKNRHFINLYELIKQMFISINPEYDDLIWFAETADEWFMNKLCTKLWSIKLEWLENELYLNKNDNCESGLYYQQWMIAKYKDSFVWNYRSFIKNYLK